MFQVACALDRRRALYQPVRRPFLSQQLGHLLLPAFLQLGHGFAARGGPNRIGEKRIVFKTGNHMPMQVRHLVAEAGQIWPGATPGASPLRCATPPPSFPAALLRANPSSRPHGHAKSRGKTRARRVYLLRQSRAGGGFATARFHFRHGTAGRRRAFRFLQGGLTNRGKGIARRRVCQVRAAERLPESEILAKLRLSFCEAKAPLQRS